MLFRGLQIIIDLQPPNLESIFSLFFLGKVLNATFTDVQMLLHH